MHSARVSRVGLLVLVLACAGWAQSTPTPVQTVIEYPIPTAGSQPSSIVTGPDGNLWFTEYQGSKIGKITLAGVITEFATPTSYSYLVGIATGPDGNLWFTESLSSNIGKITPGGEITEYPVPSSDPYGITAGPDGNLWFSTTSGGFVGRITPEGAVTTYNCSPLGTACVNTYGIAVGPDGNLWFSPEYDREVYETTTSGSLSEVGGFSPNPLGTLWPLTRGPDGNIWGVDAGEFVRITATPTITRFSEVSYVGGIATGPDGNLWFTVQEPPQIGRLTTSGTITEFPLPETAGGPLGVAAGPDGNVWFTEQYGNKIGVILLAGSASSAPTLSPTSLSFTGFAGGTAPPSQTLTLTAGSTTPFTVSATSQHSPNWLSVTPSGSLSANESLTVSVDPTGLTAGNYIGWINVVSGYVTQTLTVNLTVSAAASGNVIASPSSFSYVYTPGSSEIGNTQIEITSAAGSIHATPYTISTSVASPSGGTWLEVSGVSGGASIPNGSSETTPTVLYIILNPAGLSAGTYTGAMTLTPTGGTILTIPMKLTVNPAVIPVLTASPTSVSFTYQQGTYPPAGQWIQISDQTGATVNYTAGASSIPSGWLAVSPTSGSTANSVEAYLAVAVVSGLATGSYSGSIVITPSAAGGTAITVPVTLSVIATPVTISPSTLSFSYAGGSLPAAQSLQLSAAGGAAVSFTAQSTNSNWLSVTPAAGTAPATVTVSVSPASLAAGAYQGSVIITAGAGTSPIWVSVTMNVTAGVAISSDIPSMSFAYQIGSASLPSAATVARASGGATVSITATTSANWLSVTPASGTAPWYLVVSVNPAGLTAGTYHANVILTANAADSVQTLVPVTLTVTAEPTVSANPGSLSFGYQIGGSAPASQSVQLSSSNSSSLGFSTVAASSGGWLSLVESAQGTPATLTVSVSTAGLAVGTYSGAIKITANATGNSQTVIPVSLTVTAASTISASPTSLNFSYQTSGSAPAAQSVQVSGSGSAAVAFTVQTGNSNWLVVTPTSGTTPATLAVSVSPSGLAAGSYSGTITVNGGVSIPITLTVTSGSTTPTSAPVISAVLNAGSYSNAGVSPGEMVSIFGTAIGPADALYLTLDATGKVATSLGGVTVSFNGYLAPLTYAGSGQINAIVPYEVAGSSSATVEVTYGGQPSNQPSVALAATAPSIFTQTGSGTGPGAILNQDFSLNTQANPAAAGSVVQIYMTGEGLTTPAQATGGVTTVNTSGVGPITPAPQQSITVLIGGQPATVDFAGEAPDVVAGVLQVNAVVPAAAGSGAVAIMVRVGNALSQSGVTVWVE